MNSIAVIVIIIAGHCAESAADIGIRIYVLFSRIQFPEIDRAKLERGVWADSFNIKRRIGFLVCHNQDSPTAEQSPPFNRLHNGLNNLVPFTEHHQLFDFVRIKLAGLNLEAASE